ncbi:MAG: type IV toxin-antitoxin system AbiEi family antitoxin domain-containing protein [Fermentimonas sp.]|nr:type IV toxin-antitoxin system AbiEi family antitoxin domain-containing protein [Fermentimonas sp.]
MTAVNQIIDIAKKQDGIFTRKDLLNVVRFGMKNISEGSLAVLLNRMIAENKIIRVSYGKYKLNEDLKHEFLYEPNEFMLSLNKHIKEKFPFIDYCIWQPSVFASMMLHVPAVRTTLVDVEREAMESVFMSLQNVESEIPIFLNPSQEDVDRYITNRDLIIVRPLVKEAPLDVINGCPVPTLEKMLVDAISDKELQHLQGNELYTIYSNAFSDYAIKKTRLLRYAARRNRKQKVEQIINTINI